MPGRSSATTRTPAARAAPSRNTTSALELNPPWHHRSGRPSGAPASWYPTTRPPVSLSTWPDAFTKVIIVDNVPPERHPRRRWIALGIVCIGMTMNVLDQTIVNVALPTIQHNLHFTQAGLAWVIDAYLITFGGFLLLAGRLGDLVGRKKTFLAGVALFTVSSVACGLASTQTALIVARFAQGAGAAFSASVVLAIIVGEFPNPLERTRATSIYIIVAVGGGSLGLLLGGVLTQVLSWHWIFFINVPIGIATIVSGALLLDENVGLGYRAGLDVAGAVLSTAGLMLAIYTIVTSSDDGWGSAHTLVFGSTAVVLLVAFFVLEARLATPMMPLRVLRSRGLGSTSVTRGLMVMGMFSTFFLGALFLQRLRGFDPIETGLAFLPQTLTVAVLATGPTGWLMRRLRPKPTAVSGLAIIVVGLMLWIPIDPTTDYFPQLCLAMFLIGLGSSLAFTSLLTVGLAEIPQPDAGLGSGVINVSQQVSSAVAVAVLGVVSSNRTKALAAQGSSLPHALAGGYRLGFVVATACVATALVVCLALVPAPAEAPEPDLAPVVESVDI